MKRVLILGGTGMLGHKLVQQLKARYDLWTTVREYSDRLRSQDLCPRDRIIDGVDAHDIATVRKAIDSCSPDVVVNAIGAVKQAPSGQDVVEALEINALFPQRLAKLAGEIGFRLITVSTDCVFKGDRGHYSESDSPDALDLYGISKRFGEVDGADVLTIRTSMIGRELTNFHGLVEWFLSNRNSRVQGFTQAFFSGLTTIELGRTIDIVIRDHPELSGLYHVAGPRISKYELLLLLNEAFDANCEVEPVSQPAVDRSLDGSRFEAAVPWRSPGWRDMVFEMACERLSDGSP